MFEGKNSSPGGAPASSLHNLQFVHEPPLFWRLSLEGPESAQNIVARLFVNGTEFDIFEIFKEPN